MGRTLFKFTKIRKKPMIDLERKIIFIHNPKTAGTSIERALFFKDRKPPRGDGEYLREELFGWDSKNKIFTQHATITEIKNVYNIDVSTFFSFGFVRNPFDRLVSAWKHFQRHFKTEIRLHEYFETQVINGLEPQCKQNKNSRSDWVREQYEFFTDETKENICVDFIGRFENLEQDFSKISTILQNEKLPEAKLNKSNRVADYKHYYDQQLAFEVKKHYSKDLELFKYEF